MRKSLKILIFSCLLAGGFFVAKTAYGATEFVSIIDPDNGAGTNFTSLSAWEAATQVDLSTTTATKVYSFSSASGTFAVGSALVGYTSGATASSTYRTATQVLIYNISGIFQSGETVYIQGQASTTNFVVLSNTGDSAIAVASVRSTSGSADTTAITINGWTTSATTYIKIWTDPATGARHNGKWDDTKYRLDVASPQAGVDYSAISNKENYVRIDGLQIGVSGNVNYSIPIYSSVTGAGDIRISGSVLKNTGTGAIATSGIDTDTGGTYYIFNNVIYKTTASSGENKGISAYGAYSVYAYSNTISGFKYGIQARSSSNVTVKNSAVFNNTDDFYVSGATLTISYSASDDGDGTNAVDISPGASESTDWANAFADYANGDFHIKNSASVILNSGTSTPLFDTNLSFADDIDGSYRGAAWDIGADEVPTEFVSTICENTGAGGGCANRDYGTLSAWESAVDSDLTASSTRIFSGTASGTLATGNTVTLYRGGSSQSITGTIVATTSSQILLQSIAGTSTPLNILTGDEWRVTSANVWKASGTADQLGASPIAVAKIDGAWASADTTAVTINGWTTSADNYIKIYTTALARHTGKWDTGKYRLDVTSNAAINIAEEYFWLDGIQLKTTYSGSSWPNTIWSSVNSRNSNIRISNNIVKASWNVSNSGYVLGNSYGDTVMWKIWNNIFSDISGGSGGSDVGMSITGGTTYLYNNTFINGEACILQQASSILIAKNNITQNCTDGFGGTFAATSDYNISDIAGDAPNATFATTSKVVQFISTSTADFHLADSDTSAKGAGVNLYGDANINVTNDIDSAARPATSTIGLNWDIGADQTAVKIYRSIAPSATTALTTGASNALTISNSTSLATFATALADNIGVGDVIIYNTGGSATGTAFIHGRSLSTVYTVKTASGTAPTAISADTSWSIYRAYTSLANAESGSENTGIANATIRNFDAWSGGADLVASNTQWNIAAYGNGTTADTATTTIDGWNTGVQNFIKVYTPTAASEVGTTQRHLGKWDDGKYRLINNNVGPDIALSISADYVRVDGLQISVGGSESHKGIHVTTSVSDTTDNRISNNILTSSEGPTYGIEVSRGIARIWNNLVYNMGGTGGITVTPYGGSYSPTVYIYNNTSVNNYIGFSLGGTATVYAYNNLSYSNNGNGADNYNYSGSFATSFNNLSGPTQTNAPGFNPQNAKTVQFVDAANKDFHLAPTEIAAIDTGTNPFSIDVIQDNFNRASLGSNWTQQPGDMGTVIIDSNIRIAAQDTQDAYAFWSANSFSADQYSQAKLINVNGSDDSGVIVRASPSQETLYRFRWYPGDSTWEISKRINGTPTSLVSTSSGAAQAGDIIKLSVVGSTITGYVNGAQKLQVTDSSITSGFPGVYVGDTNTYLDDWEGKSLADPIFSFTDDIDRQARRQWDIGADEGSVEYVTSVMESGGNFSSLSAWEAANQVDLTATTTAVFSLSSASGTIPASASVMGLTSGAVASTTVGSASTSTQILLYNIASSTFQSGERIYIKGGATTSNYAILGNAGNPAIATAKIDGAWTGADTTYVLVDGWTTGPNNYVRVYTTPTARHNGKWDDTKYQLAVNLFNDNWIFQNYEEYISITGLQFKANAQAGSNHGGVNMRSSSRNAKLFSNIVKKGNTTSPGTGISLPGYSGIFEMYVANNIVQGMSTCIYMGTMGNSQSKFMVYNNTVIDCTTGIDITFIDSGQKYIKNNLVRGSASSDYAFSYGSITTSNNISQDATSPDTAFRNKTVSFIDSTNSDFHLAPTDTVAKDAGVDLSADANLAFATDIDGQYHGAEATSTAGGLGWDIGADEGATIMYRSVGNTSAALGTGDTLTVASTTATFSAPQPNNIGVGDVIQYGSPLTLAFITGRSSSTVYSIVNATGTYPVATTSASASIYRAHTLLNNWQTQTTGTVNQSINSGLRPLVLVARNLVASNTAMFVSAYASSSPDNTGTDIQFWTTGAGNYIKIYTPVSTSEVGVSQRHAGKWDDGKYRLEVGDYSGIWVRTDFTRLDGLQIKFSPTSAGRRGISLYSGINDGAKNYISNNIVRAAITGASSGNTGIHLYGYAGSRTAYIWNNVVYDLINGSNTQDGISLSTGWIGYIYNNTVYQSYNGIVRYTNATGTLKNNIVQNGTDGYVGTFESASDYNISDLAGDAPGSHSKGSTTVIFVNTAASSTYDFHLAPTDAAARDAGVSLAADSNLPFTIDIDGNTRPQGPGWDIGADEATDVPDYQFEGNIQLEGKIKFD